jgi:hypothetical protein
MKAEGTVGAPTCFLGRDDLVITPEWGQFLWRVDSMNREWHCRVDIFGNFLGRARRVDSLALNRFIGDWAIFFAFWPMSQQCSDCQNTKTFNISNTCVRAFFASLFSFVNNIFFFNFEAWTSFIPRRVLHTWPGSQKSGLNPPLITGDDKMYRHH